MIKYQVRSKELIDVVNEIANRRLIISPYFQRNLVWRTLHKIDFIKTILLGYPFPQIFIAKGAIDIERMQTQSCLVDGQQRMNAIVEYIKGLFKVDNKYYSELSSIEKENFLKYQIPIIDLDISNDDAEIIEIFKRLNRTFYSLSTIEKLATEYASSEFMLVAKLLSEEITLTQESDDVDTLPLQNDPNIPDSFITWARDIKIKHFVKFVLEGHIFSPYELSRQVHLMFTLNVLATVKEDYFNRNELTMRFLDDYAAEFPGKNDLIAKLEYAAQRITKLKFKKQSYWLNKANVFSLVTFFAKNKEALTNIADREIKEKLENFESALPDQYRLAAKEAVNNRRERLIRNDYLAEQILAIPQPNR